MFFGFIGLIVNISFSLIIISTFEVLCVDLKRIIIIILITLIFASILFGSLGNFFHEIRGIVSEAKSEFVDNSNDLESNSNYYDNHRVDYDTGMYDQEGNPIYLSEISSNGDNDLEPGVYMVYWSKLGVINQTRIE